MVRRAWLLLLVGCAEPNILPPNDDPPSVTSNAAQQNTTQEGPSGATANAVATTDPETPALPSITTFLATATQVTAGSDVTLTWSTTNATLVTLNGLTSAATTALVQPLTTTTYVLRASRGSDWEEASITVSVSEDPPPSDPPPTITSLAAAPQAITAGESTTLSWAATGDLTINGGGVSGGGQVVTPASTTTYTLKASTGSGTLTQDITVTVVPKPVISSFTASPQTMTVGASSTLAWTATGTLTLNDLALTGASKTVSPAATTTYTLKATNALGYTVSAQKTLTVNAAAAPTKALFVDAYVNGWKKDNEWFSAAGSYAITNGMMHLTSNGTTTYLGLQLSTTTPLASAAYARLNITAKGSGTLSFETTTGYETIVLSNSFAVYSIPVENLWDATISRLDIKNVSASADVYIDAIEFGPPPPPASCANTLPTKALKIVPGARNAFTTADNITHWVWVPGDYDTGCHSKPKKLFVWLHGCGGQGYYDIAEVRPTGSEDWIAMAVGGAEGACWNSTTAVGTASSPGIVMRAIADVKTRLAIKDNEVILGGYSSGGDVGYPIIFKNSKSFALALFENTAPGNAAQSTTLAQSAAPQNGWRFPIRHLCHDNDEIGTYKCAALRGIIGAGGTFATLGHASVLHEMDGTHWMPDANGRGTWADFHATLRPYLSQTWTTP